MPRWLDELAARGFARVPVDADARRAVADAYTAWALVFGRAATSALRGDLQVPRGHAPLQTAGGWAMKESYYCRARDWVPPAVSAATHRLFAVLVQVAVELAPALNRAAGAEVLRVADPCLRVMRYPAFDGDREAPMMRELAAASQLRAAPHTDLNVVTVLAPPSAPGLQVADGDGWLTIDDDPASIVVQTGRQLEQRTAGRFRACVHRVRNPDPAEAAITRMAAALFAS